MTDKKLTGFPSIDKPWLQYYNENAEEEANDIPMDKTVWDVIEESLYKHIDIPAIEYFGRVISRKEFIDNVYLWARVFKSLGVKEDEIVAYYGPFMPDICYMTFALNMIGACPYFLKLAISPEALAEETKECRIAIVFDQMWKNVNREFSKDRFEKVIIAKITDAMPAPKKTIVSFLTNVRGKTVIPKGKKYLLVPNARKLAKRYDGEVKTAFMPKRNAAITSSSGTTVGGIVKGVVTTNESMISMLYFEIASGLDKLTKVGDHVLNHFPPTAATSVFSLFFMPLFCGETIIMDPRVGEKDFYNQVIRLKPNVILTTGSSWEAFFNRLKGKNDMSYAKQWIVGGEGADVSKFKKWRKIIHDAGGSTIYSGYGQSEHFSTVTVETQTASNEYCKPIMSVGIPMAGITIGVFNDKGEELQYNNRGELWIKSKAVFKGYYNKPELTAKTKVDGWIRTGDLAEIDENGFVYIWGRMTDVTKLPSGREIYLFDIANKIKEKEYIDDAIVLEKLLDKDATNLVAHIVWSSSVSDKDKPQYLTEIMGTVKNYEPDVKLIAFAVHDRMLPYSQTTLKKDKNKMSKQMDGFVQVVAGKIKPLQFIVDKNGYCRIKNS